ncbi:MAG: hypothetical protein R8G66_27120 [Cytophagales bacterium]|nr:hypothetical protein [Cytophagales bacterium]
MIQPWEEKIRKGFTALLVAMLVGYCFFYITRHQHFLSWDLTSSAQIDDFVADTFQKGLFNFELKGVRYTLEENFEGSEVIKSPIGNWTFLLSWLGIAYLLACFTYLKQFWFLVSNGLLILFLWTLDFGVLELFGLPANSKVLLGLSILLCVGPGYAFHTFFKETRFLLRLVAFIGLFLVLGLLLNSQAEFAIEYLKANSVAGFSVVTFFFVAFVAEEIIFLILYAVTQARGKGNERHFILVSIIYLGFVTLYFLKKAGIYANTLAFLNPYFLLPVSVAVSLWTLKFKQEFLEENLSISLDIRHFLIGFGLTGFGFLSTSFIDGNDAAYESFHYLITYAHLGLGALFFLYIIMNFIDALIGGHAVYRIVYRERNFPYATAKLVGFIAIAAFFFLANKEPMRLIQGARYNYLGDYERLLNNDALADRYYEQGGVYAYNNHYSNYQLGLAAMLLGNTEGAVYRFDRATQRYPTPQAYVNASVNVKESSLPKAISYLRTSELDFGTKGEVNNNLANLLVTNGRIDEANQLLTAAPSTGDWNMATEVNRWRLLASANSPNPESDFESYSSANLPVKANMIGYQLANGLMRSLTFDTTDLQSSANLHHFVLLNNASYLGNIHIDPAYYQTAISATYNGELQENLKFADLFNRYLTGDISGAYMRAREMEFSISAFRKAELQNLIGMLLLEQGFLDLAFTYFEQAAASGSSSGAFNAAIALTEMGNWTLAKAQWEQLIADDPTLQPYFDQMQEVLESTATITFNYLYYRWQDFSAEALVGHLKDLNIKPEFVENLWLKIEHELFAAQNTEGYQSYYEAFEPLLASAMKERGAMALSYFNAELPVASEDPKNAFDEIKTINFVNYLVQTDTLAAYQAVIDASNVHENSLIYQVRYVELALDLGVLTYAEEGLAKLADTNLPRATLFALSNKYNQRKAELQAVFE